MLINAADAEEARIAVVENGVLLELHVEVASREAYLGNIYKGRVVNIEPSIGAAFVAFGGRSNGFLHASDVLPAYSRPDFQLADVIEGRARLTGDEGPDAVRAALADADDTDDDGDDGDSSGRSPRRDRGGRAAATDVADDPTESGEAEDRDDDGTEDGPRRPRRRRRRGRSAAGDEGPEPAADTDADVAASGAAETSSDEAATAGEGDAAGDAAGDDDAPAAPRRSRRRRRGATAEEPAAAEDAAAPDPDADVEEEEEEQEDDEVGAASGSANGSDRGAAAPAAEAGRDDDDDADGGDDGDADGGSRGDKKGRRRARKARPRTRVPIDQLVKKGQELIVQVTKEGIGAKGPTLTTFVSLPGRSLVMMPSLPKCGVSRKIDDHGERRRLKRIVKELDETGNGGVGFIVRTNGVDKTKADLQRDRDYLKKIWELIGQRVAVTRAPALLYQESDLVLKAMRDHFSPDIDEVVVDSKDVYLRIKDFCEKLMPHMADRVKLHELVTPLFHSFGIETEVEKLYQPRVELPNGGSIVIDQTEALVAIDVNSGRFKPGSDLDETAYRTNLEAIPEIVRQLRLRDLGGLIMIDFIDMNAEKHRRGIERKMVDALRGDRARIKVGKISPFGMLELTRQRVGPGLKHSVFTTCRHCSGSGLVRTVQSKSLAVLREVQALLNLKGYSILQVFVATPVNDFLVNYKRRGILDLEEASGRSIVFKAEPSYPVDAVHYRFLTADGQVAKVAVPAGLGVSV